MPGLVIGGSEVNIPGVRILNFRDDSRLALRVGRADGNNDGKIRVLPVSLIVIHSTKGIPDASDRREQVIRPGFGSGTQSGLRTATYWSTDPTPSGAHIVVDNDGTVVCLADLSKICAYHAGQSEVNDRSIGIETYQGNDAEFYSGQIDTVRKVVDVLTARFGIQRQIPDYYRNNTPIPRLQKLGGRDLYGVVGHRDISDHRGKGDPGDALMDILAKNGYERFNFFSGEDLEKWKARQKALPGLVADGIPGPKTNAALKAKGYQNGLWVLPPPNNDTPLAA